MTGSLPQAKRLDGIRWSCSGQRALVLLAGIQTQVARVFGILERQPNCREIHENSKGARWLCEMLVASLNRHSGWNAGQVMCGLRAAVHC